MSSSFPLELRARDAQDGESVAVNLIAVLVAVDEERPRVLTVGGESLPSGPFALEHRSLQSGLRDWVEQQTHHPIGYVEQLYTFADRDRGGPAARRGEAGARMVSISYLGLTREQRVREAGGRSSWLDWYDFFPWEDHRGGKPAAAVAAEQALSAWVDEAPDAASRRLRAERRAIAFGLEPHGWNEELALQRYELLFEAALLPEAGAQTKPLPGRRMTGDHRRILATGIARLRAKIKYRPVVFELLAPAFTLYQLQRAVEALAGRPLHKQNFRRLIESQNLVEGTGTVSAATGGRPAKMYRFRGDVLAERMVAGSKLPRAGS